MSRNWSVYQQNVFSFVETGAGNAIVEAVAGSGKTTTIVEALSRVKGSSLFLAFNKSIAEELKSRGVNARTFHSLTYGPVTRAVGARTVNTQKIADIIDARFTGDDRRLYGAFVKKLVGLARQAGIGCLVADARDEWDRLATHHDVELEHEDAQYETALRLSSLTLEWANQSREVDFDDLLYRAVKDGITLPKFDWVFVDEAQDTNAIQRAILRKVLHNGSRLIAVGDPAQAIYGFRGADSEALNLIASEFNCVRLPLTVTYRCPQQVVRFARQWVDHIEAAPGADEGAVTVLGERFDRKEFRTGDLIVCRTTKPLVALAYELLKARVPARIMGKDIGAGLVALVEKQKAKGIPALIEKLNTYTAREVEKAIAKRQDAKAEQISDRTACVLFLIDTLDENHRTVPELIRVIEGLFSDNGAAVVLATIHKAKGLEAPRVFWLNSSQCPSKWAKQEWQQQQERNLCYVAATRAKEELVLIETAA